METEPKNFRGTYPLAGERIGPAWRDAWKMLSQARWIQKREISRRIAAAHGLNEKTMDGLLSKAAKAGILDRKEVMIRSRRCVAYRVAKEI